MQHEADCRRSAGETSPQLDGLSPAALKRLEGKDCRDRPPTDGGHARVVERVHDRGEAKGQRPSSGTSPDRTLEPLTELLQRVPERSLCLRGRHFQAPHPEEREMLCAWRMAYDIEILGATDSEEHRQRAAHFLDAQIAEGNAWVAMSGSVLVSLSAFNASLPDIVQLGSICTPAEFRERGFAKAAVAASLLMARDRGASRAVLFTNNPSAVRTYAAIGFRRIGAPIRSSCYDDSVSPSAWARRSCRRDL
jgi:ribosomal protein S18 acetylase RimI-like enzyme